MNGCWRGKAADEGTTVWLTIGHEAKAELTVVGRLWRVDKQGAKNGKLTKEKTDTKGGTARNEDVPGKAFNCKATGGEVDVVKAFRGRDPTAVDGWDAEVMVEDQCWCMPVVSKSDSWLTKDDSDNPWTEMARRSCIETEGAPTAADNHCCTVAKIGVWMAWFTNTKNSGEIETEAKIPDTRACAEATLGMDLTVEVEHEEDTISNNFSKLFLIRWGGMASDEGRHTKR